MNHFDVDEAIGYVNKIIENVRCATCDRLEGSRLRYPCGHTACENCVTYAEVCQICTSPSQRSESEPKPDNPLTFTVKNATDLLKTSQNLFGVNVLLHKRISEQRRIEEELFPKRIQASVKYENKRKSTNYSSINKENRYSNYFPGEAISIPAEDNMENAISNVQQWLNKKGNNFARKPFSDLNVNTQQTIHNKPKNAPLKQNMSDGNIPLGASRKRSHFKTTTRDYSGLGGNRKSTNEYKSPFKKLKKESSVPVIEKSINIQKCENNESGIFLDNDPIVIDDSQESVIDKDKNAWLAVLKACENEDLTSTSLISSSQVNVTNDKDEHVENLDLSKITNSQITRVPFFKRSAITETCRYCKNGVNSAKPAPVASPTKPVKITIDNDNYITTITVFNNVQNGFMNTSSNVSVQTDNCKPNQIAICTNKNVVDYNENKTKCETDLTKDVSECGSEEQSIDLFADDRKIFGDPKPETSKCIVIEETDSDSDLDLSGPISVKADVHRSCQDIEYQILTEVRNMKEHESKQRRGPRGHTPTSTDSSEKENYNPNRIRKHITGKKKITKK